jgi:peptide/nickel transport system substrate-binding protein
MVHEERVAGSRTVYRRNPNYVPRAEPASGIAGGKRVNVERVEWLNIPDPATQVAALQRGEVDFISTINYDLAPVLRRTRGISVYNTWNSGTQGILRLNHLNPPFDNPAIRQAIQHFVIQPDLIMAITGDMALGQVCGALLICGSPNGSEHGTDAMRSNDPPEVRRRRGIEAMRAAGYRGEQIIILHPTDQPIQNAATLVLADSLRAGGVNVEVQAMDWATLVTRRAVREPGARGWHIFMTLGGPMGPANPALHIPMSAACDRAWFGWPCDERLEQLRAQWVRTTDPARAFAIAEDIQRRAMEITLYLSFGQFMQPAARREALEGFLLVPETIVFWNVSKRS